jgi:hypothetical protein
MVVEVLVDILGPSSPFLRQACRKGLATRDKKAPNGVSFIPALLKQNEWNVLACFAG